MVQVWTLLASEIINWFTLSVCWCEILVGYGTHFLDPNLRALCFGFRYDEGNQVKTLRVGN